MRKLRMIMTVMAVCALMVGLYQSSYAVGSGSKGSESKKADVKGSDTKVGTPKCEGTIQTKCPIMGGAVNKDLYVDYEGRRIYVCCKGCIEKVKADPQKAIDKIVANGECPKFMLELCPKCGEVKGTKKCCAKDAEKCKKCSLHKGSPGCCLAATDSTTPTVLCPKCGEVKSGKQCCVKGAAKCDKCGLSKGSPGCCKLDKALIKNAKGACGSCRVGAAGSGKKGSGHKGCGPKGCGTKS